MSLYNIIDDKLFSYQAIKSWIFPQLPLSINTIFNISHNLCYFFFEKEVKVKKKHKKCQSFLFVYIENDLFFLAYNRVISQ